MEWMAITALCAVATLVGAGIGAVAHHSYGRGQIDSGHVGKFKAIENKAQSAESLAAACLAKIELFQSNLHQHQVDDAAAFAELKTMVSETGRAQVAAEHRIAQAIEDFGRAINNMTQRIDRILEGR